MARYNLTAPETRIITSWLYEPAGYLDAAVNAAGVSARQALLATPTLNVTTWIRTNAKGANTAQSDWDECAMVWWMRASDGANITAGNRPPEWQTWRATLTAWGVSIDEAFARVPQNERDTQSRTLYAADGSTTTVQGGAFLAQQKQICDKVIAVLV